MTQLLAALNVQNLDAVIYRGVDDDKIRIGEAIKERNSADIRRADLVIALVSDSYCMSKYCQNEASTAAEERAMRGLPILVALWPTAPKDISCWPVSIRALVEGPNESGRMYFPLSEGLGGQSENVNYLCQDVCKWLNIEFDDEPDPVGRMHFIKRTREGVRLFPPVNLSRIDGDLRRVLDRLRDIHESAEENSCSRPGANEGIALALGRVRRFCENRFGPRVASYIRLGEGVFLLLEARKVAESSVYQKLCERVRAAGEDALNSGDLYTQRDSSVLLGNLALETNMPDEALTWHLNASKIARLIEGSAVELGTGYQEVRALMVAIPNSIATFPCGVSAYVLFDNIIKCHLRLLRFPDTEEINVRAIEWMRGNIAYSDPAHFARYGSLLVFAYAIAGSLKAAEELLRVLEKTDCGYAEVHLETWRVLLTLVWRGLLTESGAAYRCLWEPTEWVARRADERRKLSAREVALIYHQASQIIFRVGSEHHGLTMLSRAVGIFPQSIRLRVERATMLLAIGKTRAANSDCNEAVGIEATRQEAVEPFGESEGHNDTLYAQGVAYWLLGRKEEAEDRFKLSQAPQDANYSQILPGGLGTASS